MERVYKLCQFWNVRGFGLLPPQMFGCYNFFPWEYTLETASVKDLVHVCYFVPFITRMKKMP